MELSPAGLMELAGHEGIVLSPYRDSEGVWTVGIGHTAAAGAPDPSRMPNGIEMTLAEALTLFRRDVARYAADVEKAVTVPLAQHEFDALVSFHFNTGAIRLANLTRLLNAGDRAGAAEAFDGWHKPPEIIERRDKEKLLFRTGRYSNQGMANAYPADAKGRVQWKKGRRVDLTKALAPAKPAEPIVVLDAAPPIRMPDDPGPPAPAPRRSPLWPAVLVVALAAIGIALAATFL